MNYVLHSNAFGLDKIQLSVVACGIKARSCYKAPLKASIPFSASDCLKIPSCLSIKQSLNKLYISIEFKSGLLVE